MGRRQVAIIDPGPDVSEHVRALSSAVADAGHATIVLTHGHGDHADAAPALARAIGAEIVGPDGVEGLSRVLPDGGTVETDEGDLVAISTPGHARAHHCYHWLRRRALFAGDLMLGIGDTTWVGEYRGCVADYLASLERLRRVDVDVIYPAHGPPITDPTRALDRYEAHRRERIEQVRAVLAESPGASVETVLNAVYGDLLPRHVIGAARSSLEALLEHVRGVPA